MELDVEIVGGGTVGLEEKRLVVLVYDEEVVQVVLFLCCYCHINNN